jgi:hypothetical protein
MNERKMECFCCWYSRAYGARMHRHFASLPFGWTKGYLGEGPMGPHWILGRTADFLLFSQLWVKLCANPQECKRALIWSYKSYKGPPPNANYFLQNESSDYFIFLNIVSNSIPYRHLLTVLS